MLSRCSAPELWRLRKDAWNRKQAETPVWVPRSCRLCGRPFAGPVLTHARFLQAAAVALSSLIHALDELNMVAIVRYAYDKRANPQVGVAFPYIKDAYEVNLQAFFVLPCPLFTFSFLKILFLKYWGSIPSNPESHRLFFISPLSLDSKDCFGILLKYIF